MHPNSCIYAYCGKTVRCANPVSIRQMMGLAHLQTLAKSAFKQNYADDADLECTENGWRVYVLKIEGTHGATDRMDKAARFLE